MALVDPAPTFSGDLGRSAARQAPDCGHGRVLRSTPTCLGVDQSVIVSLVGSIQHYRPHGSHDQLTDLFASLFTERKNTTASLKHGLSPALATRANAVANKYIVTLRHGIGPTSVNAHLQWATEIHQRSLSRQSTTTTKGITKGIERVLGLADLGFHAYVCSFDEETTSGIRNSDDIAAVEADTFWTVEEMIPSSAQHPTSPKPPIIATSTSLTLALAGWALGVAQSANLIDVKIDEIRDNNTVPPKLPVSGLLEGLVWAINDIRAKGREDMSVINMSLADGDPTSLSRQSLNSHLTWTPARVLVVITVGAIDENNEMLINSSYGLGVDIFALGVNVAVSTVGAARSTRTGTSGAAGYVSGLVLYLKSVDERFAKAKYVARFLKELATKGVITGLPEGTPNLLAYNGQTLGE
ncbi:peptidase S8/S53 domain-containing protein [Cercophora newfieldiana]|uniref:Peptidase S8/S53 domain-containing protein n=1 Tax=Cercophora newfieldiana TaxID=92897 RepID=A0AA39YGF0_9PEZI|nr:peptidase S8/S53 domain-containing protein [Cercophora newfieldiana]